MERSSGKAGGEVMGAGVVEEEWRPPRQEVEAGADGACRIAQPTHSDYLAALQARRLTEVRAGE